MIWNYLLIDIDSRERTPEQLAARARRVVKKLWPQCAKMLEVSVFDSPGGKGYHVVAMFPTTRAKVNNLLIVLAQLLCYSDVEREIANVARIKCKVSNWNRLFSTKRERLVENDAVNP